MQLEKPKKIIRRNSVSILKAFQNIPDKQGCMEYLKHVQGELTNTEEENLELLLKSHECKIILDQENKSIEVLFATNNNKQNKTCMSDKLCSTIQLNET